MRQFGGRYEGRIYPFCEGTVSQAFTKACRYCGIEDLVFHDLRHEAISRLFEAGYSIPEVALVSGHKSWKHLQRYTQIRPQSLHRSTNTLKTNE
jgi:integrase